MTFVKVTRVKLFAKNRKLIQYMYVKLQQVMPVTVCNCPAVCDGFCLFQCGLGGNPMMVDKTGVGPDGDDVVASTGGEQEASDQDENPDPGSCAEPDSSSTLEKHEEDASSSEKCPFSR